MSERKYVEIGKEVGELLLEKNRAYGDSFNQAEQILRILYPEGVQLDQYQDMLTVTRVLDKLFRIATDRDALGESPWTDIAGYAILSCERIQREKN